MSEVRYSTTTITRVAEAICNARGGQSWWQLVNEWGNDCFECNKYRRMACAAIEALELTEETCTYEAYETKAVMGGEGVMRYGGQISHSLGYRTETRLISPWMLKEGNGQ